MLASPLLNVSLLKIYSQTMVWAEHHNGFLGQVQIIQGLQDLSNLSVYVRHGCKIVLSNTQLEIKQKSKNRQRSGMSSAESQLYWLYKCYTRMSPFEQTCSLMQLSSEPIRRQDMIKTNNKQFFFFFKCCTWKSLGIGPWGKLTFRAWTSSLFRMSVQGL